MTTRHQRTTTNMTEAYGEGCRPANGERRHRNSPRLLCRTDQPCAGHQYDVMLHKQSIMFSHETL